jgi:hypothetical protein
MANPVSPAIVPRIMKIMEKPPTKLAECRNDGSRVPVTRDISVPPRLARYTGTNDNTHGERNDSNPALKATINETLSIDPQDYP